MTEKPSLVENGSGKITLVLQFIEIPEPEQPLYQTVKEHLGKLVLNNQVEFLPRSLTSKTVTAQVFLNKTDLSLQMLRDGAAWYSLPEKNSQQEREREIYLLTESQAKLEKRGIWGIENLKPSWEFQTEKEELRKQQERARIEAMMTQNNPYTSNNQNSRPQTQNQSGLGLGIDMWSNVNNSTNANRPVANGGLLSGTVPNYNYNYVMTSGNFLELKNGTARQRIESRTIFVYSNQQNRRDSGYVIGFLSESEKYNFIQSNNLIITADDRKISLGKAYRYYRQFPYSVQELLLYQIDAASLTKIANAKVLQINLGKYSGNINDDYQTFIKNLLNVTR